jgi:hypothetical protein
MEVEMRTRRIGVRLTLLLLTALIAQPLIAQEQAATAARKKELRPEDKLVVLWTSGDRDVALKMVFMYTYNASTSRFGWWKDITLIVWGPSSKLLSEDNELQDYVKKMKKAGIRLEACKACADMYGVSDKLAGLGVDVKYMGDVLTNYIKEGRHVLTF